MDERTFASATRPWLTPSNLPRWTSKDVDEFVASDPVHGPRFQKMQAAGSFSRTAGLAGGLATAAYFARNKAGIHGAAMGFAAGTVTWYMFADQIPYWTMGLYKFNPAESNAAFLRWWEAKSAGSQ